MCSGGCLGIPVCLKLGSETGKLPRPQSTVGLGKLDKHFEAGGLVGEGGREMALLHRLVGWKAVAQGKAGDVRRETSCSSFELKKKKKTLHLRTCMEVQWLRIHPRAHELGAWLGKEYPAGSNSATMYRATSPGYNC